MQHTDIASYLTFPKFRAFNFRAFNFHAPWEKSVSRDSSFRAVDRKYNFVQKIYGET